jgi:protein-arginine kinase activator protein McsA
MEEHLDEEHQEETKEDVEPAICENCMDKILEEMGDDQKLCSTCYKINDSTRKVAVESKGIKTAQGKILN